MSFPDPLDVRVVAGGKYVLLKPFSYLHDNGSLIVVEAGFETDFASIPRGFRWLFTGHSKTRKPAVIHDYLYSLGQGSRKDADLVFRAAMRDSGVTSWRRHLAYAAVRVGGNGTFERA